MTEQIIVRVLPDGTVQAETKGTKGAKCLDHLALLEELLEATATHSAFTAEYSEDQTSTIEVIDEHR